LERIERICRICPARREKTTHAPGTDDFNSETGLFKRKGIAKRIMRYNQKPEAADPPNTSRFSKSDVVLETVTQISGVKMEDLLTAAKGPGANPAERTELSSSEKCQTTLE